MSKEGYPSDCQQTIVSPNRSGTNGLNILRRINSLYVKQQPSLSESKSLILFRTILEIVYDD